jgi:Ser-tRNA(Ala) deacylase AlaX
MTEKTFWVNPYMAELETNVTSIMGNEITVDRTIFFAQSGGQESDHGFINEQRVLQARKHGAEIFYTLNDNHGLNPSDRVKMVIDWERRYMLMRYHFAAEIILELVYRRLPGIEKIGAHIAQDKARIDFKWDENISILFPALELDAFNLIEMNHPIVSAYSDEEAEKRFWRIEGFAQVSCGGTHLKRTGEIGKIGLKRNNIGKGKERIEIFIHDNGAERMS